MKNAELRLESSVQDGSRDAVTARLRVYIDGEPSTAVNGAVSGTDLIGGGFSRPQVEARPQALMRCVAPHVQVALDDGRLPLPDRLGVFEVRVRSEDLRRELNVDDDANTVALTQRAPLPERDRFDSRTLESITISNFGGICQAQRLQIDNLTFLVGANGSGKSGMLTVLDLVAALAAGRRDTANVVGPGWRNTRCTEPTTISIELSQPVTTSSASVGLRNVYEAVLEDRDGDVTVVDERLREGSNAVVFERPSVGWDIVYRAHAMSRGIEVSAELASSFTWKTAALSWFRDDAVFPQSQPVWQCLSDIAVYRGWQFGGAKSVRSTVNRDEISSRLNASGSNLPEVLAHLLARGETSNQIHDALREVLPGAITISTLGLTTMEPSIRVLLDGADLTLRHLSDGTLQWLQLLAILKSPNRASVIALDEPELGLHPDCISALGNLLCDVAEDSGVRLIVATHSARLLDVFEARGHSAGMRVFERGADGVTITTPTETQLSIWCDENTTLGEAWLRGAFGGGRW